MLLKKRLQELIAKQTEKRVPLRKKMWNAVQELINECVAQYGPSAQKIDDQESLWGYAPRCAPLGLKRRIVQVYDTLGS